MRTSFLLITGFCAACATPRPAAQPPRNDVVPAQLPTADEASVKTDSEAFFAAFDANDAGKIEAVAGPTFGVFHGGRFHDTKSLGELLRGADAKHVPPQARTWKSERVLTGKGSAVFIGEAVIRVPATEAHPSGEQDEWDTLVWTHDGSAWKVAHWQLQAGGLAGEQQLWNETFTTGTNFNHKPNQLLVDWAAGKKPGTALDIAMGQGRNAVFLATQGWKVTGVDISDEGIRQAKVAAADKKVQLDAVQADDEKWDFGAAKWDLITLIYAGSSHTKLDKIKTGLKKGGTVVVEFFAKEATAGTGIGGFAPGELAKEFSGWKIVKDEVVEDTADWGMRRTKLVRFIAEKP